jgi:NAD(P)-dependent dehydrogenase (short-subunit alcohol dehydrogenase family)
MKVLITGGTNGMGKGVARNLAMTNKDNEIIIMAINDDEGLKATQEMKEYSNNPNISYVVCNLERFEEVDLVIADLKKKHDYLDRIFINAGLGYAPRQRKTKDNLDPHFQVNYLSQFKLLLGVLDLLEKSTLGGRVIFNATETGEIFWDDIQMDQKWHYERGIHQAMAAKRMFMQSLTRLYSEKNVSFTAYQISKTVWTNQINIIPKAMKVMATLMKYLGQFITIDRCGEIIGPLFTISDEDFSRYSGQFITTKKNKFSIIQEDSHILDINQQQRLWDLSFELINK